MTTDRKNISQPDDHWAAFEAQAKKEGKSLSEWIGEQCLRALPAKVRKGLSERPAAHRPKSNPKPE
jgi:hypothetical protein